MVAVKPENEGLIILLVFLLICGVLIGIAAFYPPFTPWLLAGTFTAILVLTQESL
jgi:hypothetical protein